MQTPRIFSQTLNSSVCTSAAVAGGYARSGEDASRFLDHFGAIKSVVTSSATTDNCMFEANLRDERYLSFEGGGAIGRWRLQLPGDFRQFDYATIADAILHLRYTARDGGMPLRQAAVGNLSAILGQEMGGVRRRMLPARYCCLACAATTPVGGSDSSTVIRSASPSAAIASLTSRRADRSACGRSSS